MEKSRPLEEEIYWKNFNFARFSLILPSDFHNHLKLPKKFSDNLRNQLPDKVVLRVFGVNWDVDLVKSKNGVMFKGDGWQEFAKAYSLEEADMLVFTFNRSECFEVLLFDHANLCEKEGSYFVRKPQKPKDDGPNGEAKENSSAKQNDKSHERGNESNPPSANKRRNDNCRPAKYAFKTENDFASEEEFTDESEGGDDSDDAPSNKSRKVNDGVRAGKSTCKRNTRQYICYKSNRRAVTEAEKEFALKMAVQKAAKCENSFFVVMRPTCVYKHFVLSIPGEWRSRDVLKNGEEVILRVKDKKWVCIFSSSTNRGGLRTGWKAFALGNHLEEDDVLLFVPIERKEGSYMFDVRIFRVVPETVAPSELTRLLVGCNFIDVFSNFS